MAISLGRLEVETSDHVVLRYDLAGVGNRGFAAMLDFLIATVLTAGLMAGWALLGPGVSPLSGVVLLVTALLGWSYFVFLEWLWNGQTIGKRAFGLRVINEDGSPARFVGVFVRNVVRVVDFLPAFYGFGLLSIVVSARSQRLGDLAAGTFVVRSPEPRVDWLAMRTLGGLQRGAASGDGRGLAAEPTMYARTLSGEAQRLVREFVARESRLPVPRRAALAASIAAHLRSRMPDLLEPDDVALIRAVARALRAAGER